MHQVDIYRNGSKIISIEPESNSDQRKEVMGANTITLIFKLNTFVEFRIGDYCTVFGELYKLNTQPSWVKSSIYLYDYTMPMEAESFDLAKAQYLFLDTGNTLTESDFSLIGTADTFIDLLLQNANRVSPGWLKGEVIPTTFKNLTFSKESCASVLTKLANEFDTEFAVEGKTIHLSKQMRDTGKTFRHGRNKGLYKINRQPLDSSSLITRLYVYGSDKNLPPDYNNFSKRLRLPKSSPYTINSITCVIVDNGNGTMTITFNWTPPTATGATAVTPYYRLTATNDSWHPAGTGSMISPRSVTVPKGDYDWYFRTHGSFPDTDTPIISISFMFGLSTPALFGNPLSYIENNTSLYGVSEATEIFDDVFPHRSGKVTAVDATNVYKFTDNTMPFDLNNYLLPGTTAKVTFNTGQLAGYTFEISSYIHTKLQFTLLQNKDERNIEVPSTSLRPSIGDKYVITDIKMPQNFIDAAESELLGKASAKLAQYSTPQSAYAIDIDPLFLKRKNWKVGRGDLVWIVDQELGIQRKIRVTQISRNIVDEWSYSVVISDLVTPGTLAALSYNQSSSQTDISNLQQQVQNNSILNNQVIGDLKFLKSATIKFEDIPTTGTLVGFSSLVIENATGRVFKKV
jgi:hypothetical protein